LNAYREKLATEKDEEIYRLTTKMEEDRTRWEINLDGLEMEVKNLKFTVMT